MIRFRLPEDLALGGLPEGPWDEPERCGAEFVLRTDQPTRVLLALTRWAVGRGFELPGLSVARPSLEDAYLRITGEHDGGETSDR